MTNQLQSSENDIRTFRCIRKAIGWLGISWLVKGRFLGDRGRIGKVLYSEHNQ